ncbi:hypothetical protein [Pimelobacter simplex]|uniref:hypothetical protein n=1 Tax=Nocardioides simplex TaxID=2045 RepID=UPI003AB06388
MPIINVTDLPASMQDDELIDVMVAAANAAAVRVAPCLGWDGTDPAKPAPTPEQLAEAKLILIGAVSRWVAAGAGAFTQQTAGPFSVSVDTRQRGGYRLWPSEIGDLQAICKPESGETAAYMVDMTGLPPLLGNPLAGAVVNAHCGYEPAGQWSDEEL